MKAPTLCPDCLASVIAEVQDAVEVIIADAEKGNGGTAQIIAELRRVHRDLHSLHDVVENGGLCGVMPKRKV